MPPPSRADKPSLPERGIKGTAARLELPKLVEGFNQLSYVRIQEDGTFLVEEWRDEI